MPKGILDQYEAGVGDPDLLALSDEIALARARLTELLGNVDTKEAGAHWSRFSGVYQNLLDAIRRQDNDAIAKHIQAMGDAIRAANSYYAAWNEIFRLVEVVRRVADTEIKRREKMSMVINRENALTLIEAVGHIMMEFVPKNDLPIANRQLMELLRGQARTDR